MTVDLLADLRARDLVQDSTDAEALGARLAAGPLTLYHGIDPTADSLHTGNLIGILVLRRFQDAGHRPIALAGGATGMVGDPSGRSSERNLLDQPTLDANVAAIKAQISGLLGDEVRLVDNRDWTMGLTLIDFLRDVGKHATVNTMLARESVKVRMDAEDGISFTEFSYMLLQARDYLWLADHEGCELQVGGSDQWGNIVAGVDLIRRTRQRAVHALSWPLITAADGTKLGKTTGARVWLDPARTSPFQFSQHWVNTEDREVARFLAQFTLLPMAEVADVVAAHSAAPERRLAQRRLALEVTTLVHGASAAAAAEEAAGVLFGGGLDGVSAAALEAVAAEVATVDLDPSALAAGIDMAELLVALSLAVSKGEARRVLAQGGAYLNGERAPAERSVGPGDLVHGRFVVVGRGRRRHGIGLLIDGPSPSVDAPGPRR